MSRETFEQYCRYLSVQSDRYYVITCTAVFLSLLPHVKPCVVCLKCYQSL